MQRIRTDIARDVVEMIRSDTRGGWEKPYGLAKAVSRFTATGAVELEHVLRMIFERLEEGDPGSPPRDRQVLELRLRGHSRHAVAAILGCPPSAIELSMQVAIVVADGVAKELADCVTPGQ